MWRTKDTRSSTPFGQRLELRWPYLCLCLSLIFTLLTGCGGDESEGGEAGESEGITLADQSPPEPADGGMAPEADQSIPEPVFACEEDGFVVNRSLGRSNEYPRFIGIDDRFNGPFKVISVDMARAQTPGSYDLEGKTPEDCDVCVYALFDCGNRGCRRTLFAQSGTVIIEEAGEPGGILSGRLQDVFFEEVQQGDPTGAPVEGGEGFCLRDLPFSTILPALLDTPIPDYPLQSCATGEMVNFHDIKGASESLWFIGSAGWCPACRQLITEVFNRFVMDIPREKIHPIVVLSEDDRRAPVTLEYCQRYAPRYGEQAIDHFYIDPSFEATFSHIWPYIGPEGQFGLPWNALMTGPEVIYYYADGANNRFGSRSAAINSLLR